MESELNCSSYCDSQYCLIHPGVNTQEGLDILQRLCTLTTPAEELPRRSLSPVLCAVVWTLLSSGILLAFGFLLFTLRFKNNRIVKMSSPNLNVLTLCGSVLTYISGFLFAIEEHTHLQSGGEARAVLQARLWTLCIGSTLVFGPILGKTWRLYRVFTQRVPDKRVIIRDIQLMGLVGLLILVNILVLLAWNLSDPVQCSRSTGAVVKVLEKDVSYSLFQTDSCSSVYSDLWIILLAVLKGSLLLYGTYLAGLTSNVSLPPVNQSPTIITAVSLVTLSMAVALPVWRYLHAWPNLVYSVVAGAIFICTFATNCLLFVPQLTQWRRFKEENNSPSQMARYFSSPSKSMPSAYSQDEVYDLLGENTSMKMLLNEKNAAIDSLQEQVNNAKDKLLRLMSASHPRQDQDMDSSTTNLNSSFTQTTVLQSEGPPTPLPPRDTDSLLSSPLLSPFPDPLSSIPAASASSPPPPVLPFAPLSASPDNGGSGSQRRASADPQSAGQMEGPTQPPSLALPQMSMLTRTGLRTARESEGMQTISSVSPSKDVAHLCSSLGSRPTTPEPIRCQGDQVALPWTPGFISNEQLREVLQELSVDAVLETALRSPNHARVSRRSSQPSSTDPSVPTPHFPHPPPVFCYPSISPYAMRKRRPPFHSPRWGAPACFYPGSEPPASAWRREVTGPLSPDKHSSKTQAETDAMETSPLWLVGSDVKENRVKDRRARRVSKTAPLHRGSISAFSGQAPLPDGEGVGVGEVGHVRAGGRSVRDSCGYCDTDSSSSADYCYYHRPYCDACLEHGSYPLTDSSSDSSDSEYEGNPSLWRSSHPVVNFKEDLQPTFV
ncbi:probable G-protein coupled receptor 156 [Osmerus mordax]|uniref:probable G-protein coupled receptor 156 n=1 Tax=Osmerus mordax TaxID=8014 RepID=UPI0035106C95